MARLAPSAYRLRLADRTVSSELMGRDRGGQRLAGPVNRSLNRKTSQRQGRASGA